MFGSNFVSFVKYSFPIAKFMVFITFERRDKTCSKFKKTWLLLVYWAAKKKKKRENPESVVQRGQEKGDLKNFPKFLGKHLRWNLFLTELQI